MDVRRDPWLPSSHDHYPVWRDDETAASFRGTVANLVDVHSNQSDMELLSRLFTDDSTQYFETTLAMTGLL